MARQLVCLGHEVEVLTGRPNYPRGAFFDGKGGTLYSREERKGITVHRVWLYPAVGGGLRRMINYISFALASSIGVFATRRPDYLFVESPPLLASIPARIAKLVWGVPYIFNVADLWPDAAVENGFLDEGSLAHRLLTFLENWSYRGAAYVNAVTEGIRDTLISRKSVPTEKVLFFPNGADITHYQPRDPEIKLKHQLGLDGKKIILWAGSIGRAHGLEYVLQAAKLLENYTDIHFLFLGDGSNRPQLERLKNDLALRNVTFKDPVPSEDLPPYYSIAECGLASLTALPIHVGARPSKIFAVLASGKPVIFVGAGECARLIESANAGIVIPPQCPAIMAAEVLRLIGDPNRIRQLGKNGRKFVEENYRWSDIVSKWVANLRPKPASTLKPTSVTATS